LFLSLLLNSFRFLLKPGGDDLIDAVRRPTLDLPTQTEAAFVGRQFLMGHSGMRVTRRVPSRRPAVQHGLNACQRLIAASRLPIRHHGAIALKLVGGVF
jgi:hypothetical protein